MTQAASRLDKRLRDRGVIPAKPATIRWALLLLTLGHDGAQ
jgi:hypothetical protein